MSELPKGVSHLYDDYYRVEMSVIQYADGGLSTEKELVFKNPRHAPAKFKMISAGFEKSRIEMLREAIRTEGLLQPPLLRWYDGGVQIVDGERRIRSIDKLAFDDAKCWDQKTKKFVSGKNLYKSLICKIEELDDLMAFKYAYSATEQTAQFGEGAQIILVDYFRQHGLKDKDIVWVSGCDSHWLKVTDKLHDLDEQCFEALCNDEISRDVALKLLSISNMDARIQKLKELKARASENWVIKKKDLENKAVASQEKSEVHEAEVAEAEITGGDVEKAVAKSEKAQVIAAQATMASNKHAAKKPKVTTKHDDDVNKPLTAVKIKKLWLDPVIKIIKQKACDEEGNPLPIDIMDARLVKLMCEQCMKGNGDILKILKAHSHHKK